MVSNALRRLSVCPACAGPTRTPGLCSECAEAFALARRAHPAVTTPLAMYGGHDPSEPSVGDDVELWDAWSLLGDVGGRLLRQVPD